MSDRSFHPQIGSLVERLRSVLPPVAVVVGWGGVLVALCLWLPENRVDVMSTSGRLFYLGLCALLVVAFAVGPFLLWRAQQVATGPNWLAVALRAVAAVAATASLVLAIEALARSFPIHDSYAVNPGTDYMWPEFFWPQNALGYKDRELGDGPGPRILVLGDSFTEGAGVRRPDRFTDQLQRLYRETTDPTLEVYNAGHCGMDTLDEAELLLESGDQVRPAAVIVGYVLNDADGQGWRPRPGAQPSAVRRIFLEKLGSYAFYRLDVQLKRASNEIVADAIELQHTEGSPGWQLVLESLDRIAAWADARDVPVYLVTFPLFQPGAERYRPVLDRVVAAAEARGIAARNLLDDFGPRAAELGLSAYDAHPGTEAHREVAEVLHGLVGRPWAPENGGSPSPRSQEL